MRDNARRRSGVPTLYSGTAGPFLRTARRRPTPQPPGAARPRSRCGASGATRGTPPLGTAGPLPLGGASAPDDRLHPPAVPAAPRRRVTSLRPSPPARRRGSRGALGAADVTGERRARGRGCGNRRVGAGPAGARGAGAGPASARSGRPSPVSDRRRPGTAARAEVGAAARAAACRAPPRLAPPPLGRARCHEAALRGGGHSAARRGARRSPAGRRRPASLRRPNP